MITDKDIYFSEESEAEFIKDLNVGDEYRIRSIIVAVYNDNNEIEVATQIHTYEWFADLLKQSINIQCVNDDCSMVKFIDSEGNELNELTTTEKLGSMLASNPKIHFGYLIKKVK